MKKLAPIAAAITFSAAALMVSTGANAAATTLAGGVQMPDCDQLQEDVKLPLSSGVIGAYNCIDTLYNSIRMATCHIAGRVGERTIEVPCEVPPADVDPAVPACDGSGGVGATVNRVTNTGAAIMRGSTSGGSVGPLPIDGTLCEDAGIKGKIADQ